MKNKFVSIERSCTFESSINVNSNVHNIYHTKDTLRRSDATLSLGVGVDRASEPGAFCVMVNRITHNVKWRQLNGFPEYYISNTGIVRRKQSIITPKRKTKTKYKYVLVRNFETNFFSRFDIHRLINNLEYLPKDKHLQKHGRKCLSKAA